MEIKLCMGEVELIIFLCLSQISIAFAPLISHIQFTLFVLQNIKFLLHRGRTGYMIFQCFKFGGKIHYNSNFGNQSLYKFKMDSNHKSKCNQCLRPFTIDLKPFKMPTCSHNLCQKCFEEIKLSKQDSVHCQFCDSVSKQCDQNSFSLNREMIRKIKQTSLVNSDKKAQKSGYRKKNATEFCEKQAATEADDNELLLEIQDRSEEQDLIDRLKSRIQPVAFCHQHQKPLQIICLTDLKTICPHCAIFGNHKNHTFKTLKEFYKDFQTNCLTFQQIKHKKYITEKKIKNSQQQQKFQNQLKKKQDSYKELIKNQFSQLYRMLRVLEEKITEQVERKFREVEEETGKLMSLDKKLEEEFVKWESGCENVLCKIQEEYGTLDEKIKLMYGSRYDIDQGQEIVQNLERKYSIILKKVDRLRDSIKIQFNDKEAIINSFVCINQKVEDNRKQSFMSILDKINLPTGKHMIDEYQDYSDNSFICDFSQTDLSIVLDSTGNIKNKPKTNKQLGSRLKTEVSPKHKKLSQISNINSKKDQNLKNKEKKQFGYATMKLGSPKNLNNNNGIKNFNKKPTEQKLMRSKSNLGLPNFQSERDISVKSHHEKEMGHKTEHKLAVSRVFQQIQRVPETIVKDFLAHDLKEVLDLSNCQIKDDEAWQYLKKVRKSRKIRGLKLSQNQLTDTGFTKLLEYLNSTSNLNLSYNSLTEHTLTSIIQNRDKLIPLRIINLSFNKINEQNAKSKISVLKKMGIIINL